VVLETRLAYAAYAGREGKISLREMSHRRRASPAPEQIEISGLAEPNGLVAQSLNLPAFIGRAPVGTMQFQAGINRGVGQLAGAQTSREETQQVQQETQAQALKFRWPESGGLFAARRALKSAPEAVGDGPAQWIVPVGSESDDRACAHSGIRQPQAQASTGIVDNEMATALVRVIGEDRAEIGRIKCRRGSTTLGRGRQHDCAWRDVGSP